MLQLAVVGVQTEDASEKCKFYYDIDFIDNV